MHNNVHDTIAAIASAAGGAPRGVVRLSGPEVVRCVTRVLRTRRAARSAANPHGRRRSAARCGSPASRSPLPCEVYLWPSARSYTRQPVAELHTFGAAPLLEAVLATVCTAGARLAQPGEFTLRAFLGGRIDLTQAEAVLGVIDAVDSSQLDVALAQLAGGIARPVAALRDGAARAAGPSGSRSRLRR